MRALLIALCLLFPSVAYCATPPTFSVRVFINENRDTFLESAGSGTLIAPNYVITNYHVVKEARTKHDVYVLFKDWSHTQGRIVKKDKDLDLALIWVPTQYRDHAELAPDVKIGDVITVFGYGQGIPAQGIGKVTSFGELKDGTPVFFYVYGHASRSGDSGGTMMDSKRRLAGVTFGGPKDDSTEKYAAGVRIEYVRKFVKGYVE